VKIFRAISEKHTGR